MKNSIQLFLIFIFSTITYSQINTISGTILDSLKNPIKYANVGVLNKPIGSVTNDKGEFSFSSENIIIEMDTLKISCLGFKTKTIILKNVSNKINVSLDNNIENLNEVIINKTDLKTYTEGKQKTDTKHEVIFANPNYNNLNLGTEIGKKFSLGTKKASILTSFKFFLKDNNFDMVKFRINCYTIKNNNPDKKINKSNIIVQLDKKLTGWVNVDLSTFEISTKEDIVITVEWIEHSKNGNKLNLPIIIPSFGSTHYYKLGSQGNWQKYKNISSSMILTYKQ
jgi:hypothetical protein